MSLDPISAGIDLITSVVGKIWPDKTAEDQAKLAAALQQDANLTTLLSAQATIDANEANNTSVFVSGWRPAVGWVCVLSLAWQFVVLPILHCVAAALNHPLVIPSFDAGSLNTILMGMLGLGAMRTIEKTQGVARTK